MQNYDLPTSFGRPRGGQTKASSSYSEDELHDLVEQCFSKHFKFVPCKWVLPDAATLFKTDPWILPDFQNLKRSLNIVKDELNDLPTCDWHNHTKSRNLAGKIFWQLKWKIEPELLTQAWCKFYDIVSSFPLVPMKAVEQKAINSVHLCEAPGAFITSLNHYIRSNYGEKFLWNWRATSLNPYYEGNSLSFMINDDRFILLTLNNWLYGEDYSGDLMIKSNLQHLLEHASTIGEILLVTADGSIDCRDCPHEQEAVVSWLHYCETIAALNLLSPGGSFLIKLFTIFECSTICLMYLLNCTFETVHVTKPVCSKAGNSEVYVVCCGYHGNEYCSSWLNVLNQEYGTHAPPYALFSLHQIPSDFIEQLFQCASRFTKYQSKAIQENIHSFKFPSSRDRYMIGALRHRVAKEFFDRFHLTKLNPLHNIIERTMLKHINPLNRDAPTEDDSHNQRQKRLCMTPGEELTFLREELNHFDLHWTYKDDVVCLNFPQKFEGFQITHGKAFVKVNSSKFCSGRLLNVWNRVKDLTKSLDLNDCSVDVERKKSKYELQWPLNVRDMVSLDFKNFLLISPENVSFSQYAQEACQQIVHAVDTLVCHQSLQLCGFPLLTQLPVGIIFFLSHLFQKVAFKRPKEQDVNVLFFDFRPWDSSMKTSWQKLKQVIGINSPVVLSIVSVPLLSDGDFYKIIIEMNNVFVLESLKELLSKMSTQIA